MFVLLSLCAGKVDNEQEDKTEYFAGNVCIFADERICGVRRAAIGAEPISRYSGGN